MTGAPDLTGLLLVDKPTGWTSHDVVHWVRRRVGVRRVGHGGTLDPLASGLLPVLVGPVTRLVDALHGWPKTYVGSIRLGLETETGDLEGFAEADLPCAPLPPAPVLRAALDRLTGRHLQLPPAYSAKKIGGVAAHRIARHGFAPALTPVPVTVHRLRVRPAGPGRLAFAARVSSGTYIRGLARDLGRIVGTGACLARLRRTGIGPLRVRAGLCPAEDVGRDDLLAALLPPERIPLPIPTVLLDEPASRAFRAGRTVAGPAGAAGGLVRVAGPAGLEGLGDVGAAGLLAPRVVLGPAATGPVPDTGRWILAPPPSRG